MSKVKDTLADRGQVYGNNWHCYVELKLIVNQSGMTDLQKYCMDMILMKISRLSAGNNNDKDTWHDIAGYAELSESALEPNTEPTGIKTRGGVVL